MTKTKKVSKKRKTKRRKNLSTSALLRKAETALRKAQHTLSPGKKKRVYRGGRPEREIPTQLDQRGSAPAWTTVHQDSKYVIQLHRGMAAYTRAHPGELEDFVEDTVKEFSRGTLSAGVYGATVAGNRSIQVLLKPVGERLLVQIRRGGNTRYASQLSRGHYLHPREGLPKTRVGKRRSKPRRKKKGRS